MRISEADRIRNLARDMLLLSSLGEVITIQIDLTDIEMSKSMLAEAFTDSEKDGLYVNGMVLIRVIEGELYHYDDIFGKVAEITGDYGSIEYVTALIRVYTGKTSLEMTVELDGTREYPNLLQTSESIMYFELVRFIQTKWLLAKNSMNIGFSR